jgi:outer membrane protein TolC
LELLFNFVFPHQLAIAENDQSVYDLSKCKKIGLQNHPMLLQSQLMIKYYQSGVDLAKSKLEPRVSICGDAVEFYNNKTTPAFNTPVGIIVTPDARGSIYETGITLSQPFFSSGGFLRLLGFYAQSVEREKNNVAAPNYTDLQLQEAIFLDIIDTYGKINWNSPPFNSGISNSIRYCNLAKRMIINQRI